MISKAIRLIKTVLYKIKYGNKIHFANIPNFLKSRKQFNIVSGQLNIGRYVSIKKDAYFAVVEGGLLTIGDRVSFNNHCAIVCHDSISIGDGCSFGPNTIVYDHDHKFDSEGITSGYKTAPISIGKNCWIGGNVTILRGTCIGDGCVIGAGTVVKGTIPAHSLVTSDRKMIIRPIVERCDNCNSVSNIE